MLVRDLAHEYEHVAGGHLVRVAEVVDDDGQYAHGHVGKLEAELMEAAHEQLPVLVHVLEVVGVVGLGELLLEDEAHLVDGARRDQVEAQMDRFAAHLEVGRAEHAQYVHDELLEDFLVRVRLLQLYDLVEHDELDVVVALLDDEVDVAGGGGAHRRRRRRQRDERAGRLVLDRRAGRVEERVDAAYEARSLGRLRVTHLVDELDNDELQDVAE